MLSRIELDGAALRQNFRQFAGLVGHQRLAPVLKSNAYGHGLREAYQALAPEAPAWLTVNYVSEARLLRELRYAGRILVVGPAVSRELAEAATLDLDLVIGCAEVLAAWRLLAVRPRLHIKVDTGMGRQGFMPADLPALAATLQPFGAEVVGVCTHFANVEDVTDQGYAKLQLERFAEARAALVQAGLRPMAHAASSASTLILDASRFDLARVGVSLYGVWPSPVTRVSFLQLHQSVLDLQPALAWRTEVTTVKRVAAGEFIGYGCSYRANHPLRVGVLPVGYFEGYPRLAGEAAAFVLVDGQRCPVVGRICMNMMMVDLTHLPGGQVGSVATLIGSDGLDMVSAQDVATWARTIHYELLSRLHPEIPRVLIT